jgi:hypothetical protein
MNFSFINPLEDDVYPSTGVIVKELITPEQERKGSLLDVINLFINLTKRYALNIFSDFDEPKNSLEIYLYKPFIGNNQKTLFSESQYLEKKPYKPMDKTQN